VRRGLVARGIIDLYHTDYQTPEGLAQGLVDVFGGYSHEFGEYRQQLKVLHESTRSGEVSESDWREAWKAFASGLSRLAMGDRGPVLIGLDTVEILQYVRDDFQDWVGHDLPLASVGEWLFREIFPHLNGPILWLWAGRETRLPKRLRRLGSDCGARIVIKRVEPLTQGESREYLESISAKVKKKDPQGAKRIKDYLTRYPQGLYRGTRGRPILLAMVADILQAGGHLPEILYQEKVDKRQDSEEVELDRILTEHLLNLPSPIDQTLRQMALLRKGANAELLACLMDISVDEAEALLLRAKEFVLVKTRPRGERPYFLHDEVYRLIDRYIQISDRGKKLKDILHYYMEQERKLLADLSPGDIAQHDILEPRLRALRTEQIHYKLYINPVTGFEEYFVLAEDALDSADKDMDMLLRSEVLRAVAELKEVKRLPAEMEERVSTDTAIRWGVRELLMENKAEQAGKTFKKVREWLSVDTMAFTEPLGWYLRLYEGVVALKKQDYKTARERLEHVERGLKELGQDDKVVRVLQACAAAYLGYLERLEGKYYQAVSQYQWAAKEYRQLKMGALISVLDNQAYAMTMIGRLRRARQVVEEAYRRATEQGQPYWRAHSLNIWSIVETLDGHSRTSIVYAQRALNILEREEVEAQQPSIRIERLKALIYLTMGRSYRYQWNDYVRDWRWQDAWQDTIAEAYNALEGRGGALGQLKKLKMDCPPSPYYVEALLESGCTYREMAWMKNNISEEKEEGLEPHWRNVLNKAENRAEDRLLEAAGVESVRDDPKRWEEAIVKHADDHLGGDRYLPTLSLVDLGFHYHYQRRPSKEIATLCDLVERLTPPEYHLPNLRVKKADAQLMLWGVMGKMEMLRFHEAVRGWDDLSEPDRDRQLERGVRHATLALAYDYLLGRDSFELRRAEEGLHQRIVTLPDWEDFVLPRLYEHGSAFLEEFPEVETSPQHTFRRWLWESFGQPEIWLDAEE
jgi:hypothetical protein